MSSFSQFCTYAMLIADNYKTKQLFTYSHVSCARNHDRYTSCSYHQDGEHEGNWRDCAKCISNYEVSFFSIVGTSHMLVLTISHKA